MKRISIRDIAITALFTAVIILSAWICVPFSIPLTLQIFAVVAVSVSLGCKRAVAAVSTYLLLGAVGLPVFAGFKGGFSVLFGATGGFLFGLLTVALIVGFSSEKCAKTSFKILFSVLALVICWCIGAVWYSAIYSVSFLSVLALYVLPYIVPDIVKTILGIYVGEKIKRFIKI